MPGAVADACMNGAEQSKSGSGVGEHHLTDLAVVVELVTAAAEFRSYGALPVVVARLKAERLMRLSDVCGGRGGDGKREEGFGGVVLCARCVTGPMVGLIYRHISPTVPSTAPV